jgi:hypothetical protein
MSRGSFKMAMIPLVKFCPIVANAETRRAYIGAMEEGVEPTTDVPSDWYVFEELYCDGIDEIRPRPWVIPPPPRRGRRKWR